MGLTTTIRGILGTDVDVRVAEALAEVTQQADVRVAEALAETVKAIGAQDVLEERISELETFIEDVGWERIYGLNDGFQFTREALRDIIHLSAVSTTSRTRSSAGPSTCRHTTSGAKVTRSRRATPPSTMWCSASSPTLQTRGH